MVERVNLPPNAAGRRSARLRVLIAGIVLSLSAATVAAAPTASAHPNGHSGYGALGPNQIFVRIDRHGQVRFSDSVTGHGHGHGHGHGARPGHGGYGPGHGRNSWRIATRRPHLDAFHVAAGHGHHGRFRGSGYRTPPYCQRIQHRGRFRGRPALVSHRVCFTRRGAAFAIDASKRFIHFVGGRGRGRGPW